MGPFPDDSPCWMLVGDLRVRIAEPEGRLYGPQRASAAPGEVAPRTSPALRGSYIPLPELKDLRDLTWYRTKTVQAQTSEIERLANALEAAGIKLDSVVST